MVSDAVKNQSWTAKGVGDSYGWSMISRYETIFNGSATALGFLTRALREKGIKPSIEDQPDGSKKVIVNDVFKFQTSFPTQAGLSSQQVKDVRKRGFQL